MSDQINNSKTPGIDQLSKDARSIYYKEHEFERQLDMIKAEIDELTDNSEGTTSVLYLIYREVKNILETTHEDRKDEIVYYTLYYIKFIIQHLIEVDSAYERLYRKILADIEMININLRDRIVSYDIPSAYNTEMKTVLQNIFGKKSPYLEGKNDLSLNDLWTVKSRNSVIMMRDMDMGNRMTTIPIVPDPSIPKEKYIKLFSFTPLLSDKGEPIYLGEIIIAGSFYAFKGYLKSEVLDHSGNRGAIFDAEYGISYDIPYSFKIIYDNENNKIIVLFKHEETAGKLVTVSKLDFSIQLLVGKNLVIEERNTIFDEPLTA
jgi:hypothetical protein